MHIANVLCGHIYGSVSSISCVLSTLVGSVSGSAVAVAAIMVFFLDAVLFLPNLVYGPNGG